MPRLVLWLLLFKLLFSSGCVKLFSGDPNWRHLTALAFHYQTQPLPTWMGWYANQLPLWFQKWSCAGMFGSPEVLALLANNPFPGHPPRYVRAELYDYRFTSLAERHATGSWWKREFIGEYLPPLSLPE